MDGVGVTFSATAFSATALPTALAAIISVGVASTVGSTTLVGPVIAALAAVALVAVIASLVTVWTIGDDLPFAAAAAAVITATGARIIPRAVVPLGLVAGRGGTLGSSLSFQAGRTLASTAMVGLVGRTIPWGVSPLRLEFLGGEVLPI